MSDRFRSLRGIILMAISVVVTLWLAFTNQLVLYIHPRYIAFTVIMALFGLVLVIASVRSRRRADDHAGHDVDHSGHDHTVGNDAVAHAQRAPLGRTARVIAVTGTALTLAVAGTLLVLPPATLSAATADQRDINSTALSTETTSVADVTSSSDAAFAKFTVLDWASLLRQTSDQSFYDGKPVDVVGFISAAPDDPENVFYVSRFIITCCAVDAQPVGLPVYLPDWQNSFAIDDWVGVSGGFVSNPSSGSGVPISLVPEDIAVVERPAEPYLY